MKDSLPNIYYSSESNKFINLANIQEISSSTNTQFQLSSQKLNSNQINGICQSKGYLPKLEKKEDIIQFNDLPKEISGTIISISDFNVSNENIVIGGITLYIQDDNGNKFEIQANPKDLIMNVIEKYRKVAKIDNNHRIFLMKKSGEGLHRQMSLNAQKVEDKDIIIAKQLNDEIRKKLKDNIKKGFTYFIIDSDLGKEAFYGKGDVMFKIFADKFREKHQGKKFIFRYSGITINDEKKTIEELGFEQSERIFALLINENI